MVSHVGASAEFRDFRGRYSSFRAAGVAKSRAEGVPISLDRARRSAGGTAIPAAAFGVIVLIALLGWPFVLTTTVYAHAAGSTTWSVERIMFGVLAVLAWIAVLLAVRSGWQRTSLAQRRQAKGLRDRALMRLGEAAADAAGAFNWDEIVLRDGAPERTPAGTVLRNAGQEPLPRTAHVDAAWAELAAATGRPAATVVHVLPNGEIWGGTTPADAGLETS